MEEACKLTLTQARQAATTSGKGIKVVFGNQISRKIGITVQDGMAVEAAAHGSKEAISVSIIPIALCGWEISMAHLSKMCKTF